MLDVNTILHYRRCKIMAFYVVLTSMHRQNPFYTTLHQRRYNVMWHCIDVNRTLFKRNVTAGYVFLLHLFYYCRHKACLSRSDSSAVVYFVSFFAVSGSNTIDSRYLELSEILRDIRISTYQNCRIEEKINRTTTFNKCICKWTLEIRDILKILWKRGEIALLEQFLLFSTIFCDLLLDFRL